MISAKQMARVYAKTKRVLGKNHKITKEIGVKLGEACRRQLNVSPYSEKAHAWRVGPTALLLVENQKIEGGPEDGETLRTVIWYNYVTNFSTRRHAIVREHRDLLEGAI